MNAVATGLAAPPHYLVCRALELGGLCIHRGPDPAPPRGRLLWLHPLLPPAGRCSSLQPNPGAARFGFLQAFARPGLGPDPETAAGPWSSARPAPTPTHLEAPSSGFSRVTYPQTPGPRGAGFRSLRVPGASVMPGHTGARRHRRFPEGEPQDPARRSAVSPGTLPLEAKGNLTTRDREGAGPGQARPDYPGCEQGRRRGRLPVAGSRESQSQPVWPARPMVGLLLGLCAGISLAAARAHQLRPGSGPTGGPS